MTPQARGAEVERLVTRLRGLCSGMDAHVLMPSLTELYARIVSDCIHDPDVMEQALARFTDHVRGWWIAARGGPFRPM